MRFFFYCTILFFPFLVRAQGAPSDTNARVADMLQLRSTIKSIHPAPFRNIDMASWDRMFDEAMARADEMTPSEFGVALQQLVALLEDAHTSVNPQMDVALSKRRYPIELYLFEDGLFVRSAAAQYKDLVGAKVTRIGNATSGAAIAAAATTVSHENTWWVRAMAPQRLVIPEVLEGLGIVEDGAHLSISVERDGNSLDAVVEPVMIQELHGHGGAVDMTDWIDMRSSDEMPLWQQNPHELMWWRWLPDSGTLYVCYRAVASRDGEQTNAEFWDDVFREVDAREPNRLVLDIRDNGGGNGMLNRSVIQQILRRPAIDVRGKLFAIIGRRTFSAGQQLANQLAWWTQATFVGEPTGQRVSQYGDAERVRLENSGISVFISTRFHQAPNPLAVDDFVAPDIYAPLRSEEYRAGVDPALQAILDSATREPVIPKILGMLQVGQYEQAEKALAVASMDPANRYKSFESEVNGIGYDLLGSGQTETAIAVFRMNTHVYPASANTFDSLGEALLSAGRHEEAMEAYRKALEIDPTFPSSLEALRRLETHHGE